MCKYLVHQLHTFLDQEVFLTFTRILVCCMEDYCTMLYIGDYCLEEYSEAADNPECSDTSSYEHALLYPHNICGYECNTASRLPGALSPIKPLKNECFIQTPEYLPVLNNQTKLACFGFHPTSPPNENQQVDLLCHSTCPLEQHSPKDSNGP